jgi:nitrogen fixation protein
MDHSVSLIDHYEFLSQDHCEHPIVTHGHMWPSKIQIWSGWEKGMPKPPSDRPALKQTVIAAKLSVVERSTKLGSHREPQFDAGGHPIAAAEVQNEWAVVYGRIVRSPKLNHDCGVGGCGGDDVPLIIIAELTQVRRVTVDGNIMPGRLALARLHV